MNAADLRSIQALLKEHYGEVGHSEDVEMLEVVLPASLKSEEVESIDV